MEKKETAKEEWIFPLSLVLAFIIAFVFFVTGVLMTTADINNTLTEEICKTANTTIKEYDKCIVKDLRKEIIPNLTFKKVEEQ